MKDQGLKCLAEALNRNEEQEEKWESGFLLRLVFTCDGVVVGVAIRRVERYDLVRIKPTESEAEHWFCLRCLRSSKNCIVGVASRSGRRNQWQCSIPDFAIGWFFCFFFRRSRKRNRKKWKRSDSSDSDSVELITLLTTPIFDFH